MSAANPADGVVRALNELETLRRLLRLYPADHPALGPAFERARAAAGALAGASVGVLGIGPDEIFWNREAVALSPLAPAARLQATLFHLGLAAVRLRFPDATDGLFTLVRRLAALREPPSEAERDALLDPAAAIPGVELLPLDLSGVELIEEEAVTGQRSDRSRWGELVSQLFAEGGFRFGGRVYDGEVGPGMMVDLMQRVEDPTSLLDHVLKQLGGVLGSATGGRRVRLLGQAREYLSELLGLLDPERRHLAVRVAMRHLPVLAGRAAREAPLLAPDTLIEAAESFLDRGLPVPQEIREAIELLAASPESWSPQLTEGQRQRAHAILAELPERSSTSPPEPRGQGAAPAPAAPKLGGELAGSLGEAEVRLHLLRMLGEAVTGWPGAPVAERAAMRLAEEFVSSLDVGDFEGATRLAPMVAAVRQAEARQLACTSGVAAAVRALHTYDRGHHPTITAVLVALGERALPAIIEALAVEEGLGVRRRLIEVLVRQGERAVAHLLPLLEDPRWFVVRNAVFVLRRLGNREMLPILKGKIADARPQLLAEMLKALVAMEDPEWFAILSRELESEREERARTAIAVAAHVRHPAVVAAIQEQLQRRIGMRLRDEPLTLELVRALGRLRAPSSLPLLQRLTGLRQWRYPFSIGELRREAAVAIAQLEGVEARRIAAELSRDRDRKVAEAVQEALQRPGGGEETE
ncbi:MAG: hypothetical protein V1750_09860 [Acidobacteriota bacterium]